MAGLLAGCQIASSPPEVSVTTTRTRGATSTPAAAPSARLSSSPAAALPTVTATARPASPAVSPTTVRTPTTLPPTVFAPTLALPTRLVAATPAPNQRTSAPSPTTGSTGSVALPTFARATILPPPGTATAPGGLLPGGGQQLSGEVLNYAASARVLQLKVGGTTREVSLAPNAAIRRADGAPASAADMRAGEQVEVVVAPSSDGALVASALTIVRGP
jgi:hypothetical protein